MLVRRRTATVVGPAAAHRIVALAGEARRKVALGAEHRHRTAEEHRRTAVVLAERRTVGSEAHRRIAEAARSRSPEEDRRTGPGAAVLAAVGTADTGGLLVHLAVGKGDRAAPGRPAADTAGKEAHRRSLEAAPAEDLAARTSSPTVAAGAVFGRAARSPVAAAGSRNRRPEAARSRIPEEAHRSPEEGHSQNQDRVEASSGRAARRAAAV